MSKVTRPLPELVSKTVRTAFAHIEADRVESLELNFTDAEDVECREAAHGRREWP